MSEQALNEVVSLERLDGVAVIRIDNPPINAGSAAVRQGVLAAIRELDADAGLTGAILMGAGKMFMAGSDMREFGAPVVEPHITEVIRAMQDSPKPIVAAIAGAALGGGYELSLGCDARIAKPDAVVGLPECLLGMMPGAGGTQALPRLVGMVKSVELICAGSRVKAAEAARIGMIEAVVEGDLLPAALAHLAGMGGRKRRFLDLPVPPVDEVALEQAKVAALAAGRGRPNIRLAIQSIENARELPVEEALVWERKVFLELRAGREAAALRHLFFAEREAAKRAVPLPTDTVGERIDDALLEACDLMLEAGALPEQIDAALEEFGFAVGPFAAADAVGLDAPRRSSSAKTGRAGKSTGRVHIADALREKGRLGVKAGAGYYRYGESGAKDVDPTVTALIEQASRVAWKTRRAFSAQEIVERALAAMANEAAFVVADQVVASPADIDLVLTKARGFPRHEGGVVFWAQSRPEPELRAALRALAEVDGGGFRLGPVELLRPASGKA